jgi:ribosome-binding factor A
MKGSRRPEQVAENIRQVVAEALTRDVRDPRVGLVTVTRVEVTGDLSHATVFVTLPSTEEEPEEAMQGLASARGFLRSKLAKVLTMRSVPTLTFKRDRGLEHARHIDSLLDAIDQERQH